MSAAKTIGKGMRRGCRIASGKILDSGGRPVPKGINTLIVIPSDKGHYAPCYQLVDELLVNRIQILIFVHNQLLKMNQRNWIEVPGNNLSQALTNNLARQHA